jgi:hypothetical protein
VHQLEDDGGVEALLDQKALAQKPGIDEETWAHIDEHFRRKSWCSAAEIQRWLKQAHHLK